MEEFSNIRLNKMELIHALDYVVLVVGWWLAGNGNPDNQILNVAMWHIWLETFSMSSTISCDFHSVVLEKAFTHT